MRPSLLNLFLVAVVLSTANTVATAGDVRISQVYGGGGNGGATFTHDFIELYNAGPAAVALTGWSVQYASAAGTSWAVTTLTGTIAPGGYYLVREAQGAGGTTALPTPDTIGTIAMSATAGKVALASSITALTGANPVANVTVVDFVGYGTTANAFEGAPAPALSNTTAALRAGAGAVDTNNNATDFSTGTPTPRNSGSGGPVPTSPTGSGLADPASVLPGASTRLTVQVTQGSLPTSTGLGVNVNLSAIGGAAAQIFFDDGSNGDAIAGDLRFTFTASIPAAQPVANLALPATIIDAQGRSGTTSISLAVIDATPGPRRIHDIQGAAHRSPLTSQAVVRVPGIVTATRSNGFYLQDPVPDADPATSEGIFVFTSSAPAVTVGSALLVSGTVTEFRPGGASSGNLTTTELIGPFSILTLSTGNPLPEPAVVKPGGRLPPTAVIKGDATGDVEAPGVPFDPAVNGLDFYESLEGMRVSLVDAVVVGPTNSFGEIPVLSANGAEAGLRTARGGILARSGDFNPERIFLDDGVIPMPQLSVGDHFDGTITGVLEYSFGNFKLSPDALPPVISGGLERETTTLVGATNAITVATYNVENLDSFDTTFAAHAAVIVNNLRSPDVIGVEEIQDNNGTVNDGLVDATYTAELLIAAIQAAGGPTYQYRDIAPWNNQDGGQPGGNIRVGFLFNPERVTFVDRAGGDAATPTTVLPGPVLSVSPGRIDPLNPAFINSRKPLVGEFLAAGKRVFVIVNHFNSKGGDDPLFGQIQPPVRSSEIQRHQQAQVVHDFVAAILAQDAAASVVVLGDLNDFDHSETLSILKGDLLHNLADDLPEAERYDYVFEGNAQTLDHILVSNALAAAGTVADIVHVNAEFADQISDHDPIVARLVLNRAPTVEIGADAAVLAGVTFTRPGVITDPDAGDVWGASVDYGDGSGGLPLIVTGTGFTLSHVYAASGTYTVTVTVSDNLGASGQDHLTVTVTTAPTVEIGADAGLLAGATFTRSGVITDPDAGDAWTANVDYGDGSGALPLVVTGTGFTLSHVYAASGTYTITVTVTDSRGASGQDSLVVSAVPTWVRSDLGPVLLPGFAQAAGDNFVLAGFGRGFFGNRDEANLFAQTLTGNGIITARLDALLALHPQAFAGITLRADRSAAARHVTIGRTGQSRLRVLARLADHAATQQLADRRIANPLRPLWLRLARQGGTITAKSSTDGQVWTTEATVSLDLGPTSQAGLVSAGGGIFIPAAAAFSAVEILPSALQ